MNERADPPPQVGARFDERGAQSGIGQRYGGGQAGDPAAEDDGRIGSGIQIDSRC